MNRVLLKNIVGPTLGAIVLAWLGALAPLPGWVSLLLVIPLLLYLPGHLVMLGLYPLGRTAAENIEPHTRAAFAIACSLAVTAFVVTGLNFLPPGLTRVSILLGVSIASLFLGGVGFVVQRGTRYADPSASSDPIREAYVPSGRGLILVIVLAAVAATTAFGLGAALLVPEASTDEPFTAIYVTDRTGTSTNPAQDLLVGQNVTYVIHVENHRGLETQYSLSAAYISAAEMPSTHHLADYPSLLLSEVFTLADGGTIEFEVRVDVDARGDFVALFDLDMADAHLDDVFVRIHAANR